MATPQYTGPMRRDLWKIRDETFVVFFIVREGRWVVFEAGRWHEGPEVTREPSNA